MFTCTAPPVTCLKVRELHICRLRSVGRLESISGLSALFATNDYLRLCAGCKSNARKYLSSRYLLCTANGYFSISVTSCKARCAIFSPRPALKYQHTSQLWHQISPLSAGIVRSINSSNIGTVKSVSPGLESQTMPLLFRFSRVGHGRLTLRPMAPERHL
jgi:hypothetical protein